MHSHGRPAGWQESGQWATWNSQWAQGPEFADQIIIFCSWVVEAPSGLVITSHLCSLTVLLFLCVNGTSSTQFCCCSGFLYETRGDFCSYISAFFGGEELKYRWGKETIGDWLAWQRWCVSKLICRPMHFKNWKLYCQDYNWLSTFLSVNILFCLDKHTEMWWLEV